MQRVIVEYFSNLFQTSITNDTLSDREKVHKISEELNKDLVAPITSEEVKAAVFTIRLKNHRESVVLTQHFSRHVEA